MHKKLNIIVLSHNRPILLQKCLSSLKKNKLDEVIIQVSDNSSNYEEAKKIASKFGFGFARSFTRNGLEHIKERLCTQCDYLMLMHDDDEVEEAFIEQQLSVIDTKYPDVLTCAQVLINEKSEVVSKRKNTGDIYRMTVENLLMRYFNPFYRKWAPAFPSYIYAQGILEKNKYDQSDCGKHSDVPFVFKATRDYVHIFNDTPLYRYRIHGKADSAIVDREMKIKMFEELKKEFPNLKFLKLYEFFTRFFERYRG